MQTEEVEERIQEQAQNLEAARRSFEEATAETRLSKFEGWKQELVQLEERLKQLFVEVLLQPKQAFTYISNRIIAKVHLPEEEARGKYLFQPKGGSNIIYICDLRSKKISKQ